jgi:hypothetical protein
MTGPHVQLGPFTFICVPLEEVHRMPLNPPPHAPPVTEEEKERLRKLLLEETRVHFVIYGLPYAFFHKQEYKWEVEPGSCVYTYEVAYTRLM